MSTNNNNNNNNKANRDPVDNKKHHHTPPKLLTAVHSAAKKAGDSVQHRLRLGGGGGDGGTAMTSSAAAAASPAPFSNVNTNLVSSSITTTTSSTTSSGTTARSGLANPLAIPRGMMDDMKTGKDLLVQGTRDVVHNLSRETDKLLSQSRSQGSEEGKGGGVDGEEDPSTTTTTTRRTRRWPLKKNRNKNTDVSNLRPSTSTRTATTGRRVSSIMYVDSTLQEMEPVLQQYLEGVTVPEWVQTCWLSSSSSSSSLLLSSDNDNDDNAQSSLFGRFLEASGNHNVFVGPWTQTVTDDDDDDDEGTSKDALDPSEQYLQRRTVTFAKPPGAFNKSPIQVKQVQTVRYAGEASPAEEQQRQGGAAIVAITVRTSGIPFEDAFEVRIRWVVTPVITTGSTTNQPCCIRVQVGCKVVFHKNVLVAGAIRKNTLVNTKYMQTNLLEHMKGACGAREMDHVTIIQVVEDDIETGGVVSPFDVDDGDASNTLDTTTATNPAVWCLTSTCKYILDLLVSCLATITTAVVARVLRSPTVQDAASELVVNILHTTQDDPQLTQTIQTVQDVWNQHQHEIEAEHKRNDPLRLFEQFAATATNRTKKGVLPVGNATIV